MKQWLTLIFLLQILLAQAMPALNVYTYGSFTSPYGPGPLLKQIFEKKCNCTVNFVSNDTSLILAKRLLQEQEHSKADVVIGIDALSLDVLSPLFRRTLQPYSFTCLSLVYDNRTIKKPPQNLEELARSDSSLIVQDPRTSTTGLNFIAWLHHLDPSLQNLKEMAPRILTYTKGWSQSYALFLKGEADFVLSYTSSPLYHDLVEASPHYRALTFEEGHICSHEYMGIPKASHQSELAQQFIDFVLSKEGQQVIAEKAWVYPMEEAPQKWINSPAYMVPEKMIHIENLKINTPSLIEIWKEVYQ